MSDVFLWLVVIAILLIVLWMVMKGGCGVSEGYLEEPQAYDGQINDQTFASKRPHLPMVHPHAGSANPREHAVKVNQAMGSTTTPGQVRLSSSSFPMACRGMNKSCSVGYDTQAECQTHWDTCVLGPQQRKWWGACPQGYRLGMVAGKVGQCQSTFSGGSLTARASPAAHASPVVTKSGTQKSIPGTASAHQHDISTHLDKCHAVNCASLTGYPTEKKCQQVWSQCLQVKDGTWWGSCPPGYKLSGDGDSKTVGQCVKIQTSKSAKSVFGMAAI